MEKLKDRFKAIEGEVIKVGQPKHRSLFTHVESYSMHYYFYINVQT